MPEEKLGRVVQRAAAMGTGGRDGVMAVATRQLGWRLVKLVGKVSGGNYGSMGQGVRRFWRMAESRP